MVAGEWVSVLLFFSFVGVCIDVFRIPVMFSAYSNLLFVLGEMLDRSKDRPVSIIFNAVVGIP